MPQENPYKPPVATVRDLPRPPRSPTFAVIVGIGIYYGGTIVSNVVVAMLYTSMRVAQGGSVEEFDPRVPWFGIAGFITGGACSFLAGYVCARLVRRKERRVTVIVASLNVAASVALALGVTLLMDTLSWLSLIGTAVRLVAVFLLVLAGGELGRRRNLANARDAALGDAYGGVMRISESPPNT